MLKNIFTNRSISIMIKKRQKERKGKETDYEMSILWRRKYKSD